MAKLFQGLERIEEARERLTGLSFMAGLYDGRPDFGLLFPAAEPPEEKALGEEYCRKIEAFLTSEVDPGEIERTGRIPDHVFKGLFALGAFGMKIPQEYGGLGFSYTNYGRVLTLIATWNNALALSVAVPQSIGIAMPLLLFGSDAQRRRYLPLVAQEAISAFALTEPITGSDAANIATEAVQDAHGDFIVNGEKLWCTNGPIARYLTLIARVPARREGTRWVPVPEGKGPDDHVHTAFVLDMSLPGVEVRQHCQFEGCRGIENGHLRFHDVRIPADSLIGEVGKGLKYALTILNVGRAVSIPAICLGMAKQAWQPTLDRANTRMTFRRPLAARQTQQMRIGHMAARLFAMEALAELVWRMADDKRYDVRIEAAIAKIYCSEETIRFVKDAQIIFGGLGYETAESKRVRGEPAFGIEQLVRDAEMYRIGEGATDILRPFVVREALGSHLERARDYVAAKQRGDAGIRAWFGLARRYAGWYARQWSRPEMPRRPETRHPQVSAVFREIERLSRRLAWAVLLTLARHQEHMQDDQGRQTRIEAIGEELLTLAAAALRGWVDEQAGRPQAWELVDLLVADAKERVRMNLVELRWNRDEHSAAVGREALQGRYGFLSNGGVMRGLEDYRDASAVPEPITKLS